MPSETLQLLYSARPRGNRRRPTYPALWACARVVLWVVAVGIVVAILIKLGVFEDPERKVYVATGFPFCPKLPAPIY
jgi:hypothetical protein